MVYANCCFCRNGCRLSSNTAKCFSLFLLKLNKIKTIVLVIEDNWQTLIIINPEPKSSLIDIACTEVAPVGRQLRDNRS